MLTTVVFSAPSLHPGAYGDGVDITRQANLADALNLVGEAWHAAGDVQGGLQKYNDALHLKYQLYGGGNGPQDQQHRTIQVTQANVARAMEETQ